MVRYVKVVKQGNTLTVSLPAPFREALRIRRGDTVAMTQRGQSIVVSRVDEGEARRELVDEAKR